MVESDIIRTSTEQERRDYRVLGTETPQEMFLRKLAEVEMKFIKQHLPFDGACAKLDFADELERVEKENERIYGYVRKEEIDKLRFENLEKYGEEGRFELLEDDEDVQDKVIEGMRTQVVIGHTIKYRCKQRGHGISVFLPNDVYKERFKRGGK